MPAALGANGDPIFRQAAISDIACGPSALYNALSHGNDQLQGILTTLRSERTPKETVRHLIDTYGKRRSATNPSVTRYGRHNGGVGSVNLLLMARELLAERRPRRRGAARPELRQVLLQRGELRGERARHLVRRRGRGAARLGPRGRSELRPPAGRVRRGVRLRGAPARLPRAELRLHAQLRERRGWRAACSGIRLSPRARCERRPRRRARGRGRGGTSSPEGRGSSGDEGLRDDSGFDVKGSFNVMKDISAGRSADEMD